jgi:hypothetical protein
MVFVINMFLAHSILGAVPASTSMGFGVREGSLGALPEEACVGSDAFSEELGGDSVCTSKILDYARSVIQRSFGAQVFHPRCAWGEMHTANSSAAAYFPTAQYLAEEQAVAPERRELLVRLVQASRCSSTVPDGQGLVVGDLKKWIYETTFGEWMRDSIGQWARLFRLTAPAHEIGLGRDCIKDYEPVTNACTFTMTSPDEFLAYHVCCGRMVVAMALHTQKIYKCAVLTRHVAVGVNCTQEQWSQGTFCERQTCHSSFHNRNYRK